MLEQWKLELMSRRERDRWQKRSPSQNKREIVAQKALMRGMASLTAEERKVMDERPKARSRGVQVEDQHARILAARAHRHWWRHGFTRVEHRTSDWREAEQRMVQGAQTGMPDFWLFVPPVTCISGRWLPVRAVCELKAPQHAPKRSVNERWWLDDWPEGQQSWHALRKDQWRWLRLLHGCGFRTMVAYGHDEAEAFFVDVAGPKPDVMPEGW